MDILDYVTELFINLRFTVQLTFLIFEAHPAEILIALRSDLCRRPVFEYIRKRTYFNSRGFLKRCPSQVGAYWCHLIAILNTTFATVGNLLPLGPRRQARLLLE